MNLLDAEDLSDNPEHALVGSYFLDDDPAGLRPVLEQLHADDFSHPTNRRLWPAMQKIARDTHRFPLDPLLVALEVDAVNDTRPLQDIAARTSVGHIGLVPYYARHVIRRGSARTAALEASGFVQDLTDSHEDAETRIETLAATLRALRWGSEDATVRRRAQLSEAVESLDKHAPAGIRTGFPRLDQLLYGLEPGTLVIVAARPSVGKTAWSLQVALQVAMARNPVLFFSAEMQAKELYKRAFSHLGGVDFGRIRSRDLDNDAFEKIGHAQKAIYHAPFEVNDADRSIGQIIAHAHRWRPGVDEKRQGLIVVDYLQRLTLPKADRRDIALGEATKALKDAGKDLNCAVLVLCQIGRGVEKEARDPSPSDLKESGKIEEDADVILFLTGDAQRPGEPGRRVLIGKNRNGPLGSIPITWTGAQQTFTEEGVMTGGIEWREVTDNARELWILGSERGFVAWIGGHLVGNGPAWQVRTPHREVSDRDEGTRCSDYSRHYDPPELTHGQRSRRTDQPDGEPVTPTVVITGKHLSYVRKVVSRMRLPDFISRDEFVSAGYEGLLDASRRFDPAKGTSLESFAYTRIHGAVWDLLRGQHDVLSRDERRVVNERPCSDQAAELSARRVYSLDADPTWAERISDASDSPEDRAIESDRGRRLRQAISTLPYSQRTVMRLTLGGSLLREIGRHLGLTESRVCQIYAIATKALREQFTPATQETRA